MRILITGGGTGGHVYPGLAVAEALMTLDPASEVLFVGTSRGLESTLVPKAGWPFVTVPASGMRGLGWGARGLFMLNLVFGVLKSLVILLKFRPAVVMGTGGYVSVPVMVASRLLGKCIVLQEQNSVPGSTNKRAARWARRIYLGFAEAAPCFSGRPTVVTGNPVRRDVIEALSRDHHDHWDGRRPLRLLAFGGSRGARSLNEALIAAAAPLIGRHDLELWFQTGPTDYNRVSLAYAEGYDAWRGSERLLRVEPYIDDMAAALRWADLVISRAGAMTLAELAASGRPAVLVPFPHATDDHQARNARGVAEAGAAEVLPDDMCTGEALIALVDHLCTEPSRLAEMALASRRRARPDAAAEIAVDILRLGGALPADENRS